MKTILAWHYTSPHSASSFKRQKYVDQFWDHMNAMIVEIIIWYMVIQFLHSQIMGCTQNHSKTSLSVFHLGPSIISSFSDQGLHYLFSILNPLPFVLSSHKELCCKIKLASRKTIWVQQQEGTLLEGCARPVMVHGKWVVKEEDNGSHWNHYQSRYM